MLTTRVAYLQALLEQTGNLSLPLREISLSELHLSLDTIAQPLRMRHTPLAAEDLALEAQAHHEREQLSRTAGQQVANHEEGSHRDLTTRTGAIAANAIEALSRSDHQRMVILGGPGSGKTTAIKTLLAAAARSAITDESALLPVFVSLPELAQSDIALNEHLRAALGTTGVSPDLAEALVAEVASGHAIVCLDGLDEVSPQQRPAVISQINALAAQPGGVWVVGSRFTEYKGGQFSQSQFDEWELEPLNARTQLTLAQRLLPALRRWLHTPNATQTHLGAEENQGIPLSPTGFIAALDSQARASSWGRNPLLFSLAAVAYARSGFLPTSRSALYASILSAALHSREADPTRHAEALAAIELLALDCYRTHGRAFTRQSLIENLAEVKKELGGSWEVSEMATRTLDSGVIEPIAGETFAFTHQTIQEYLAAAAIARGLVSADPSRRGATWALAWGKRTYSRWTETMRFTVGALSHEHGGAGEQVAIRWLRALVEQRRSPSGDPGDLGLALAITSLRETSAAGASALGGEVIDTWSDETRAALSTGTLARQERLIRMMVSELSILPDALAQPVVEVLISGLSEPRDRSIRALAAAALGELEERAPGAALAREITTTYHSDNYEAAAKALARMGANAPIDLLVEATRDEYFSDPQDQSEHNLTCRRAFEALGYLGDHAPLDVLVRGLYSPTQCVYAAEGLGKLGERAIPALMEAARSPSGFVRACAMLAFTRLALPVPLEVLLAGLKDPLGDVRAWAISALGKQGSIAVIGPLIECLRKQRETSSVRHVLQALAPSAPVDLFLPLLEDEEPTIRREGLAIAAKMGSRAPIARIMAMTADPDMRTAALDALAQLSAYVPVGVFTAAVLAPAREDRTGVMPEADDGHDQVELNNWSTLKASRDLVFTALAERTEPEATDALLAAYHRQEDAPSSALVKALACHADRIPSPILLHVLSALHQADRGRDPIQAKAIRTIGASDSAWPFLRRMSGATAEMRCAAVQALETLGDVEPADAVAEVLLKALRTGTDEVRSNAYKAFASIGSSLPAQPLLDTLHEVAQAELMWPEAAKALGDRAPVAYLLSFLEHEDAALARAALAALMQITTTLSDGVIHGPLRAAMMQAIHAPPSRLWYAILRGMAALGERAPVDVVVALATVGDGTLRERAYSLLVTLGAQVLESTLPLLTSSDPQRHTMAVEILTRLAKSGVTVPAEPLLDIVRANPADYTAAHALGELANRGVSVPVDEILTLLIRSDGDDYLRQEAIVAFGEHAVPYLILSLGQEHPREVRERALDALESLWRHTPEGVFIAALRDETTPARWHAASALGQLAAGNLGGAAHSALVQAVSDRDPHVGWWAITALRNASLPIPVEILEALAHSTGWYIGERAIGALGYQRDHAARTILIDLLRSIEPEEVRRHAAEALGCLAQHDVDVTLEPLKAAMRGDEDYRVRRAAFDALLSLGDRAPVHDLLAALDDSDGSLRQHATEKLVSLGQRVPDERWLALLGDADPKVRLLVASALAKRHPKQCFPVLVDLLDETTDLRWAVQRAITDLGMSALDGLRLALEDERPVVRNQSTILINTIVSAQREEADIEAMSPELITAALGDPRAKVRANMLTALAERRDVHETGLMLAAIADSAAEVRSAALLGLKRCSAEAIHGVLAEAVAIVRDGEAGVLFDALAQSQVAAFIERATGDDGRLPPPLVAILTDLLEHPYWEVRAQAATALGKLRRGIPDVALQRLTHLLRDESRAVSLAADDALAQVLSLEASIEDAE